MKNPREDRSLRAGKEVIKTRARAYALARERGDRLLHKTLRALLLLPDRVVVIKRFRSVPISE